MSNAKSIWMMLSSPDEYFFSTHGNNSNVLNYGCGSRKTQHQIGVDISESADADYIIKPGAPLPFAERSFDMVISRFVLEHVTDLEQLLSEICRVLKPGGIFRFCVPHAFSIDMFDDPTHRRFYTLRTMNYFIGSSNVHYVTASFSRATPYLRLTLGWPRWRIIRYPMNLLLGIIGLLAPNFGENLLKLPFVTGTLYFELEKRNLLAER